MLFFFLRNVLFILDLLFDFNIYEMCFTGIVYCKISSIKFSTYPKWSYTGLICFVSQTFCAIVWTGALWLNVLLLFKWRSFVQRRSIYHLNHSAFNVWGLHNVVVTWQFHAMIPKFLTEFRILTYLHDIRTITYSLYFPIFLTTSCLVVKNC